MAELKCLIPFKTYMVLKPTSQTPVNVYCLIPFNTYMVLKPIWSRYGSSAGLIPFKTYMVLKLAVPTDTVEPA